MSGPKKCMRCRQYSVVQVFDVFYHYTCLACGFSLKNHKRKPREAPPAK